MLTRKFLLLFLLPLTASVSQANGWFHSEQPYKSGNGTLSNSYQLTKETLDLDFQAKSVSVNVKYQFNNRRNYAYRIEKNKSIFTDKEQTTFIFPIVCDENTEPGYFNLERYKDCGISISGKLNGAPISFTEIRISNPNYNAYNTALLSMRNRSEFNSDFETVLYKANLDIPKGENTLTINYSQNYHYTNSGNSKSPIEDRSDNKFIYDFRPASIWDIDDNVKLTINIKGGNDISFTPPFDQLKTGSNTFKKFKLSNNILTANLTPTLNDLTSSYTKVTNHTPFSLSIKASHALKKYPISNLFDGDTNTAWCTNSDNPVIDISIKNISKYPLRLDGFLMTAGYTKTKDIRLDNRRPKTILITTHLGQTQWSVTDEFSGVPISFIGRLPNSDKIPFAKSMSEFNKSAFKISLPRAQLQPTKIKMKFTEAYDGDKYKDFCISELIPLFPG